MSAIAPEADVERQTFDVRFVPTTDMRETGDYLSLPS
jgi:hypothetical protein